jgi:hypothetical protein
LRIVVASAFASSIIFAACFSASTITFTDSIPDIGTHEFDKFTVRRGGKKKKPLVFLGNVIYVKEFLLGRSGIGE